MFISPHVLSTTVGSQLPGAVYQVSQHELHRTNRKKILTGSSKEKRKKSGKCFQWVRGNGWMDDIEKIVKVNSSARCCDGFIINVKCTMSQKG